MSDWDVVELIKKHGDVLSRFFDHITDMVFLMAVDGERKFRYVMMNKSAMREAGLDETAYGKRIDEVYPEEIASVLIEKYQEAVEAEKPVSYVLNGSVTGETTLTPILDKNGVCTHVFAVTRDITARRKREEALQYLAYHDTLTGLPNRRRFEERLSQVMEHARQHCHSFALLFLDCDQFKTINDTHGHDFGDFLLKGFAKRLRNCVREDDCIARLGGDEFIILLPRIESRTEVLKVAYRIIRTLRRPWYIHDQRLVVTVSVGISLFPEHGETIQELMRRADEALYQAKAAGKNRCRLYADKVIS